MTAGGAIHHRVRVSFLAAARNCRTSSAVHPQATILATAAENGDGETISKREE